MSKFAWALVGLSLALIIVSFGLEVVERSIFPVWEPNYFSENPASEGPYNYQERVFENNKKIDGTTFDITLFYPTGLDEPLPGFVWLVGSNVQAYYQQSLHETLASWGYMVIVPESPPFSFTDTSYHQDILLLASEAIDMALSGEFGSEVDETRLAAGGYSTGASLAAFLAGRRSEIDGLVYWAPSGSPYWLGINEKVLYSRVTQPALYVLGGSDVNAPPSGGYPDTMQKMMPNSFYEEAVIKNGQHHFFQQPTGADKFSISDSPGITRYEQQGRAIDITREWLKELTGDSKNLQHS